VPRRFKVLIASGALVGALVVPASPADAAFSFGESSICRTKSSHCIIATGKAVSGGSSLTGGQVAAACEAAATGASIVQVTCTAEGHSRTRSFTGTAGAAELQYATNDLDPVPVCWSATAYWPNPNGGTYQATTSGCGLAV
jgi:hypothetical protein